MHLRGISLPLKISVVDIQTTVAYVWRQLEFRAVTRCDPRAENYVSFIVPLCAGMIVGE